MECFCGDVDEGFSRRNLDPPRSQSPISFDKEAELSSGPIIFQWRTVSFEGGKSPSKNPLLKILGNEALCESVEF